MAAVRLTQVLREEYERLFQSCRVRPDTMEEVTIWAQRIAANRERYRGIGEPLDVPWHIVGITHYRECGLDFNKHLHNGDPLTDRTKQEPIGRPKSGAPPFTFEQSAVDALRCDRLETWGDWSLSGTLYKLESFNGFGYRQYHPHVLSPYLWGRSNLYVRGGYPKDGVWSETYVNRQLGSAVLLRRLSELGMVGFDVDGSQIAAEDPSSVWSKFENVRYDPENVVPLALELQKALNKIPGIHLLEDGRAGDRTSNAFKRVTGGYLQGDPRKG
jgi:lysozyme family protein